MIRIARYLDPAIYRLNEKLKFFETKTGFLFTEWGLFVPKHRNILGVLTTPNGKLLIPASNIVTSAGDIYYAQKGAGVAPTNAFGTHFQASAGTPGKSATYGSFTGIAGSVQANDGTYPTTADADTDNTGAGASIITHRVSYTKASFNAASISHGGITIAAPVGGSAILTGFAWPSAFSKTVDDTLKVFVNHTMLGV